MPSSKSESHLYPIPIITTSDCEGAGQMFAVTCLVLAIPPRTADGDFELADHIFFIDYAYLTVERPSWKARSSPWLSRRFTPSAQRSRRRGNTSRHLAEFWMIEPEMAFYDLADNMDLAEEFSEVHHRLRPGTLSRRLEFFNEAFARDRARPPNLVTQSVRPRYLHRCDQDLRGREKPGSIR